MRDKSTLTGAKFANFDMEDTEAVGCGIRDENRTITCYGRYAENYSNCHQAGSGKTFSFWWDVGIGRIRD